MAVAQTKTSTSTWTRTRLLVANIRAALSMTTRVTDDILTKVFNTGIEKQYLGEVHIWATSRSDGKVHALLELRIDWERNAVLVKEGFGTVELSGERTPWKEGTSPQIHEAASILLDYARRHGLNTEWTVQFAPGVDAAAARAELGLVIAERKVWAEGEVVGESSDVRLLGELTATIRFVDQ